MPITEIAVWSAMLGSLLTLSALALADVMDGRNLGSVRNLAFVLITGASCVVMTGLPEIFFPELPVRLMVVLKAGLGPLAGAMGLYFVGTWLGGAREDNRVHRLTAFGGIVLVSVAVVLVAIASQIDPAHFHSLLLAAAAVNMVPVLLALVASVRAARLGDPLARWMALAIVCLAITTTGHYLNGLHVPGLGLGTQLLTATATVLFFLMSSVLGLLRNRHLRELARLSRVEHGSDPATGLPSGSVLLADVEHAFWRAARLHSECSVVCLYVSNLYELAETVGPGVEHQILVTMAARIRRTAGFRCTVGLYHPRCFVVVMSLDARAAPLNTTAARMALSVSHPMVVFDDQRERKPFRPRVGLGVVTIDPSSTTPMQAIHEAERRALAMVVQDTPANDGEHGIETAPAPLG
ncbi:diguanylate cyclase [Hydrogenophaga sp. 2FB]|uniref:diguanylate cyclase n=1 Tax=Hydrogenophaga sp. 2FB TaxID=2502187 RepID=UPI0010F55E82|nr:diguanylate cyclase [Hydrogenophaga sp. 2FB]